MSFGTSISDIISVVQLATQTYKNCKGACGKYAEITNETRSLHSVLRKVEQEVQIPGSPLNQNTKDRKELGKIVADCKKVLTEINGILEKRASLGTSNRKFWDRLRFGNKDFGDLRQQLLVHTNAISVFISTSTATTIGRVDGKVTIVVDAFPEIRKAIDNLASQMRSKAGSVWTTYSDDDTEV